MFIYKQKTITFLPCGTAAGQKSKDHIRAQDEFVFQKLGICEVIHQYWKTAAWKLAQVPLSPLSVVKMLECTSLIPNPLFY